MPRRKAHSAWLRPGEGGLFPAKNHASHTSVQQADCSPELSWASAPAVPASETSPPSVLPLSPRWQQTQQEGPPQAGGSQASCVFDELESWQAQLMWTAHAGGVQAAARSQPVLPSAQPRGFFPLIPTFVKWHRDD